MTAAYSGTEAEAGTAGRTARRWRCRLGRLRRGLEAAGVGLVALVVALLLMCRTSASLVLRTASLSGRPYGLAIDARTHRAFVIGYVDNLSAGPGGRLAVLDTTTGALLRTVTLGDNPTDMAIDAPANRVFVTDILDGTVDVLDARTSALLRTVSVGEMAPHDLTRIVVDARTNRVFVSTTPVTSPDPSKSTVRVLDARTGALLRTVRVGGGSLAVDEQVGRVFVANFIGGGNSVAVLDARTGSLLRAVPVGYAPYHLAVSTTTARVFVTGDRGMSMLDAHTGTVLRSIAPGALNDPMPAVDEAAGRVFVTDGSRIPPYSGRVWLLDARSGRLLRTVTIGSPGDVAIDTRSGRVFIPSESVVDVLDAHTGTVLYAIRVAGQPIIDERTGHLLLLDGGATDRNGIPTDPGTLSILDARSGAVLASATIGWFPGPVALDESVEHAVVVTGGGPVHLPDPWAWVPSWLRDRLPFVPRPVAGTRTAPASVSVLDVSR